MTTSRQLGWAVALLAMQSCSSDEGAEPTQEAPSEKHSNRGGPQYLQAEFDLFFASQEDMDAYYQASRRSADKAVVITRLSTGADLTWQRNGTVLDMRYCVSNTFANAAQARTDIADAARAWEAVSNVRFRYVGAEDGNCTNAVNNNVDFRFFPTSTVNGACGTPPFLSAGALAAWCPFALGTLAMNYAAFTPPNPLYPNITNVGVLRHELGHMLGLRHEHPWAPGGGGCSEQQSYDGGVDFGGRQLTTYDQSSVMHYPQCGGNANTSFSLSELDGQGMRSLYGMPAAWYVAVL